MSASGRTGRNGIESDFRFLPVAEATAARHGGRFLREHLPGVGTDDFDIFDNLTHAGQFVRYRRRSRRANHEARWR